MLSLRGEGGTQSRGSGKDQPIIVHCLPLLLFLPFFLFLSIPSPRSQSLSFSGHLRRSTPPLSTTPGRCGLSCAVLISNVTLVLPPPPGQLACARSPIWPATPGARLGGGGGARSGRGGRKQVGKNGRRKRGRHGVQEGGARGREGRYRKGQRYRNKRKDK